MLAVYGCSGENSMAIGTGVLACHAHSAKVGSRADSAAVKSVIGTQQARPAQPVSSKYKIELNLL
jgi:hypothetical protein